MFKLAISNIAWEHHDDPAVLELLKQYGVAGIEAAPSKVWPEWQGASGSAAAAYRRQMEQEGFELPAMQAILFGKPELRLFDSSTYPAFLEHLKLVAEIAHGFGAKVLVFGAPKNRRRGRLGYEEAMKHAAGFLRQAGELCHDADCVIGIEANPAEYCCDFCTNLADVRQLVELTASPAVRLHFDTGAVQLNGENLASAIREAPEPCHYHMSEPQLANLASGTVDHATGLRALRERGYGNWISIEMRREEPELEKLKEALEKVKRAIHDSEI